MNVYTEEELNLELIRRNKEAAKAEMDFNESFQNLAEFEKLNFFQWIRKEELVYKKVRVMKRNNRENLIVSINILKKRKQRLNFLERKLRRRRWNSA